MAQTKDNMFSFEVNKDATKDQISQDIKKLFNVDAVSVNTVMLPGKKRRVIGTRKYSKMSMSKKAIVKLKEGQKIELFSKE